MARKYRRKGSKKAQEAREKHGTSKSESPPSERPITKTGSEPIGEDARDTEHRTLDTQPTQDTETSTPDTTEQQVTPDSGKIIGFPGARKPDEQDPRPETRDTEDKPDIVPLPTEPLEEELPGLGAQPDVHDEDLPGFDESDELDSWIPEDPEPGLDAGPGTQDREGEPDIAPPPELDEGEDELPGFDDEPDELPGLHEPDMDPTNQDTGSETLDDEDGLPGLVPQIPEAQDPGPETRGPVGRDPDEERELDAFLSGAPNVTYRGGTTGESALVLVQMFDDNEVREITLQQDIVKIGKLDSSHLRIDDEDVSRMHSVMECVGGNWKIIDLGSSEGTIVNNVNVNNCGLVEGDEIRIGSARFKVKQIRKTEAKKEPPVIPFPPRAVPQPAPALLPPAPAPRAVPQPAPTRPPSAAPQDPGSKTQDPGPKTAPKPGPPQTQVSGMISTQEQQQAQAGETVRVDKQISWSEAIMKSFAVKATLVIGGAGATAITSTFGAGNLALVPFIAGLAVAIWYTINDKNKR